MSDFGSRFGSGDANSRASHPARSSQRDGLSVWSDDNQRTGPGCTFAHGPDLANTLPPFTLDLPNGNQSVFS